MAVPGFNSTCGVLVGLHAEHDSWLEPVPHEGSEGLITVKVKLMSECAGTSAVSVKVMPASCTAPVVEVLGIVTIVLPWYRQDSFLTVVVVLRICLAPGALPIGIIVVVAAADVHTHHDVVSAVVWLVSLLNEYVVSVSMRP